MFMKKISAGFTLVELLVALTINTVLFGSLIGIFIANSKQNQQMLNINRLNQQLETTISLMSDEIRRAGYWANASNDLDTGQNNNPFMTSATDITVNGSNNCILFTYDHANNGTLPAISSGSDDDRYGFLLSGGAVMARPPGAGFSCTSSGWEIMTDTNLITITALSFILNTSTVTTGPGTKGIMIRSVDISITGQLVSDATVTKTLTQHVRIRNDKFIP